MSRWRGIAMMAASGAAVVAIVAVGVDVVPADQSTSAVAAHSAGPIQHPTAARPKPARRAHHPALHCRPVARACVDLRHRLAWLQDAAGRVTFGPVRTGVARRGQRTPHGLFRVAWKAPHWVSTEYGIPMPWSVFFAAGGIAFHAGPLDEPSHGCVHLRPAAAHRFFEELAVGDRVYVH